MTNSYYTPSGTPVTGSSGASAVMRAEFQAIQIAFNLLPALTPGTAVVVNAGGTALTNTTGKLTLGGDFTTTAALTLAASAGATLNIGAGGTLGPAAYVATGTSGGVLGFTSTNTLASSAALAANAIVLGGGAGATPTTLGSTGTATTVLHGNSGGAPSFGAVALTTDVSGVLGVTNGGTGVVTLTAHGVVIGNGTSGANISAAGSAGQPLLSGGASADPAYGTLGTANGGTGLTSGNFLIGGAPFLIDGGGSAITTGSKGFLEVPFACTINAVTMLADQSGSIVVEIRKCTYAQFDAGSTHPVTGDKINSSTPPTIANTTKSQDTTLGNWTTAISAGDILQFNVNSATAIQRVTVSLKATKT